MADTEMGGLVAPVRFITIILGCFSKLGTMRKLADLREQWRTAEAGNVRDLR